VDTDRLNRWLTLVANLGVIAGIVFLGYELRQNTLATKITAADNFVSSINEANSLLISDKQLSEALLKARRGEQLSDLEELALGTFWNTVLRNWQRAFFLSQEDVLDASFWRTQEAAILAVLCNDRSLYDHWQRTRERYESEFNHILDSAADCTDHG